MGKSDQYELLHEGKTKSVFAMRDQPDNVILRNKDDITKNDDPSQTKVMSGKAALATTTTCAVFQLLKDAGIPVAFVGRNDDTSFISPRVEMIPLEVVWRRYAVGSFLKRYPNLQTPHGKPPHRFHRAVFELFLKTTNGIFQDKKSNQIEVTVDDPLIDNPSGFEWRLVHPKKPGWKEGFDLKTKIPSMNILPNGFSVREIESLLRRVGLILESAWAQLECRLIDFKIELGIATGSEFPTKGALVVADVIDADSWRLRDNDWQELSKQLFRDNVDMHKIAEKYSVVAKLASRLRIPKQALVFWGGSDLHATLKLPKVPGVNTERISISGEKSPRKCLNRLEKVLAKYPEGGVILTYSETLNELGLILSARTSWTVIEISAVLGEYVAASNGVPMLICPNFENAVLAALNVLGQKNPAAYAERQLAIEELDN